MILEKETFERFGYYPKDLKSGSNKKILVACDKCGKIRELCKNHSCSLCHPCAMKSEIVRYHMSQSQKGKKSTEQQRLNLNQKGRKFTEEHKRKISKALKGKIRSEEHCKHIGIAKMGIPNPKCGRNMQGKNNPMFGKKHTKRAIEKIRVARCNQVFPLARTSIELIVEEQINKYEILYHDQWNLGNKFSCDFYCPDMNLIIECDGDYWHSLESTKKRDKAKNAYAKACGISILRLPEHLTNNKNFDLIKYLPEEFEC